MKINFIGDIHGSNAWKGLVNDDETNVFLGDYFDPYDNNLSYDDLIGNFHEIVEYKNNTNNTFLLCGNHDFHYLSDIEESTRKIQGHSEEIRNAIVDADLYGFAWEYNDEVIASHAGATKDWFDIRFGGNVPKPGELVKMIEEKVGHPSMEEYWDKAWFMSFTMNCAFWDTYGDTPTQSPIWVRPETLLGHNLYKETNVIQVVGHTMVNSEPLFKDNVWFVDCLRLNNSCLVYDTDTKEFKQKYCKK